MKLLAALLLLFTTLPAPIPDPHYFRYTRSIQVPAGAAPQVCAVLEADVFAHASPTLADLRLYANQQLLPYATTISASTLLPADPARVLKLGMHGKTIAFDVEMPPRSYTQLTLDLAGANFTATARVTGLRTPEEKNGTSLGAFTLFDLSAQRLSRSTTLALPESTFPFLHVELAVLATPAATQVTLAYGDPTLQPPLYDLARLFNPAAPTRLATLGAEQANPSYTSRPAIHRSFTEAHPELLWLALLGVIGVLAVLAFRARPQ